MEVIGDAFSVDSIEENENLIIAINENIYQLFIILANKLISENQ